MNKKIYGKKILTEEEFYYLEQCSHKYFFSKTAQKELYKNSYNIYHSVVAVSIKNLADSFSGEEQYNIVDSFNNAIDSLTDTYSNIELEEIRLNYFGKYDRLMKELKIEFLVPIKTDVKTKIVVNTIKIETNHLIIMQAVKSGIMRSLVLSPYDNEHSVKWSLMHRLQYESLRDLHKDFSNDSHKHRNPELYIIYIDNNNNPKVYRMKSNPIRDNWKKGINLLISKYKNEYHYPLIGCKLDCEYKDICKPCLD